MIISYHSRWSFLKTRIEMAIRKLFHIKKKYKNIIIVDEYIGQEDDKA